MEKDVNNFVKKSLHCLIHYQKIIPRPLAEQVHASRRNEIIHYDYLYSNSKNQDFKFILVLKDDLTNYVQLSISKGCDHFTAADALLQWYSRFGHPSVHVSDNGTYFKNNVIKELRRLTGSNHHLTVAYSPWANGTVEVVDINILRLLRSLTSEFKLYFSEWPLLMSLVQGVINHTTSRLLNNLAPVTLFKGLSAERPFNYFFDSQQNEVRTSRLSGEEITILHGDLCLSLQNVQKQVLLKKSDAREQTRNQRNKRNNVQQVNFGIGDFVLVSKATSNMDRSI